MAIRVSRTTSTVLAEPTNRNARISRMAVTVLVVNAPTGKSQVIVTS